jgi:nucleotide-binding universal stress UspA family protein
VEVLVASSDRASLIVVGHAQSDNRSVAARVAEQSAAPVIVFRPPGAGTRPTGRLVVGVPVTDDPGSALEFAFEEAQLRGTALSVVHVRSGPGTGEEAARSLAETVAEASARFPGVPVRPEVRSGRDVAAILADAARGAALVVVGQHRGGPGDRTAETVSRTLIDLAACPVAVVATARRLAMR